MNNSMIRRIKLSKEQYGAMKSHVKSNLPKEACGILLGLVDNDMVIVQRVKTMRNIANSENIFSVDSEELYRNLIRAESLGLAMVGVYHSHHMSPRPSSIDNVYMKLNPVVWVIFGLSQEEIIGVAAYIWHDGRVSGVELEVG